MLGRVPAVAGRCLLAAVSSNDSQSTISASIAVCVSEREWKRVRERERGREREKGWVSGGGVYGYK